MSDHFWELFWSNLPAAMASFGAMVVSIIVAIRQSKCIEISTRTHEAVQKLNGKTHQGE